MAYSDFSLADLKTNFHLLVSEDGNLFDQIPPVEPSPALADLPTFTRLTGIELRVLFSADTALSNPYTLYVIRSARADSEATRFSAWALADWRARLLSLRLPGGEPAFAPLAGGCIVPDTAAVQ